MGIKMHFAMVLWNWNTTNNNYYNAREIRVYMVYNIIALFRLINK